MIGAWLALWLGCALAQALAWARQRRTRDATPVDIVWSLGMAAGALLAAALGTGSMLARALVAVLGGGWALRLAWHLARRHAAMRAEDSRYRHLRARWGERQGPWFWLFQAQALLAALFALPFFAAAGQPDGSWRATTLAALAVWLAAVGGEALADRQLEAFRRDPANRGRVMQSGLWRVSRHPNYFFEWLHWWTYPLLAAGAPQAWLAWVGPVLMFVFLRWISGVPHAEAQALRSRGDAYRAYQRRTPIFFPWFPRSATA